jgi:folate-binding protein YgfZ
VTPGSTATAVALPGPAYLLIAAESELADLWRGLSAAAQPAGAAAWDGWQIRTAVPWVLPPTQELFLPQALGLEQHGAVSFEKGCYPGQEIVARTHYLGEVKRHLAYGRTGQALIPGQNLMVPGENRTQGVVVNAAPSPDGGWELLAVAQREAMTGGELAADGQVVRLSGWAAPEVVSGAS